VRARHRVALRMTATIVAVGLMASVPQAAAAPRDHLRVDAWVLDFDPLLADGRPLTATFGWTDPTVLDAGYQSDVRAASAGIVDLRIGRFSTIRGYPAKSGGFRFTNESFLGCLADSSPTRCGELLDYAAVLNETFDPRLGTACDAIRRGRIDEVWLWGGPWFGYLEQVPVAPRTLCPTVDRTFVVMGFNYERGVAEMLHDLGHRTEGLVQSGIGLALWDRFDGQRGRYAQDYSCPTGPDAGHPEVDASVTHAGNVHFPPNAYCHYQYDRSHPVLSDADDWLAFPALTGRQTEIDSTTWGGTHRGFLTWWLGHLPRRHGSWNGIDTDWWRYVFPARNGSR
jgi:hypothetical protein